MRVRFWMSCVLACGLVLSLTGPLQAADVLVLKNGRKAEGKIVEETKDRIKLQVGSGSMWYPRASVKEILRDADSTAATPTEPSVSTTAKVREEHGLLYRDGKRVGVRTLRVIERPTTIQFEEDRTFAAKGEQGSRSIRIVERSNRQYLPQFLQIRERTTKGGHRLLEARMRAGQLVRSAMIDGRRQLASSPMPSDGRFPLALREHVFHGHAAMDGRYTGLVYDLEAGRWSSATYESRGAKHIESTDGGLNPEVFEVLVLERRVGKRLEREWLSPDFTTRLTELDGSSLRFLPAPKETVERIRKQIEAGPAPVDLTPRGLERTDLRARVRHVDAAAGWSVAKPDPSWLFEKPDVQGAGALLSVRNAPLSATVDVQLDPTRREKLTVETAAEAVQRLLRAVAPDLSIVEESYVKGPYGREYWFEATATTKGEKTRTMGRVVVRGKRAFRLLAASPTRWFDLCKKDFRTILTSFRVDQ